VKPGSLLPLAKSWISPPAGVLLQGAGGEVKYDPAQRAYVVQGLSKGETGRVTIRISSSEASPLVNPAIVLKDWDGPARMMVTINGKRVDVPIRSGVERHLEGDSVVFYLKLESTRTVELVIDPGRG